MHKFVIGATCACLAFTSFNVNASVINPSFEDGLTGWNITKLGNFGNSTTGKVTDGERRMFMWSLTTCALSGCGLRSFSSGDYISLSQSLDMSSVDSITFDIELDPTGSSNYQSFMEAAVYIDSIEVWSSQAGGMHQDISIDTILLTGIHALDFRIQAIGSGSDTQSDHLYIDNIRVNPASVVPVPAAFWLFGSGLVGLIGIARRKKS